MTALKEALESAIDIYYAHPYASYERGSQENMHCLVRRFIPKGTRIENVSDVEIERIQPWINAYPRKILGYSSAPKNASWKS
ncbi:IS30 family transposase [Eremococcus coleocola]|uniref:IS30 family transposase n=1 Tax=Eremococcus coleocola TaxID=88132 RepID=UPI0006860E19|nr:IS30 family transposase [Eremococcus coleocola]